jgi:Trk K+ transport system NAD-binding subunit/nucleotide-binding universal stress UspA family protein
MRGRLVIVGAGRVGRLLADRLGGRFQVLLLDVEAPPEGERFFRLPQQASALPSGEGVVRLQGDGSSRLVLQSLLAGGSPCPLVASAGSDEVNLEVCRLGRELGFQPVVARVRSSQHLPQYRQLQVTALDEAALLADHLESSLRFRGAVVPVGVGLGKGELLEITLLATSPLAGRPLKEVAPHRWRVAAVFRGDQLLVPTGATVLQADDRVLLVGDPQVLLAMAEHLRLGRPQFPHPFGATAVTLEYGKVEEAFLQEANWLAENSVAQALVRGIPGAGEHEPFTCEPGGDDGLPCREKLERHTFNLKPQTDPDFDASLSRQLPGVVLWPTAGAFSRWRFWGACRSEARLCDRLRAPVIFARGKAPYRKILLPFSDSPLSLQAAETAIDLTRMFQARLTVLRVESPELISGKEAGRFLESFTAIQRLAQLYELQPEYLHLVGNPVRQVAERSAQHDLLVVARRWRRRNSFFDPDVALEIARRARCSVLVLTVRPEG